MLGFTGNYWFILGLEEIISMELLTCGALLIYLLIYLLFHLFSFVCFLQRADYSI